LRTGAGLGIDTLPISKRMKDLIRGVENPDHPYASRSEAVFAVIVAMVGGGCADDQIEAVFLDTSHPISAHVLEQPKPSEYLARQIAEARKADPHVARLNEHHALVIVGDKCVILKTTDVGIKRRDAMCRTTSTCGAVLSSNLGRGIARGFLHT
jgi:hypothetical protein